MAYAEQRGNLWRARWRGPDGTLESMPGFQTRDAAEDYGRDQEAYMRNGTYVAPRAGQIAVTEWVNEWYPALDLEISTLANYRYAIETHILPDFGDRTLQSLTPQEIAAWEMRIVARGYSRRTARDARTVLTTVLGDAVPRHIQVNPAQRKRGKGRKGQRRIERSERAEKAWASPLQVLLIAERCAALSGRDADFVMNVTLAYSGMRWSEMVGLAPAFVDRDVLHVDWKLYEQGGRFYRGRPKDGSIRPVDLPPFLAEMLALFLAQNPPRRCSCANSTAPWCGGAEYVFLSAAGSHFSRSGYGEHYFRPAADGWYPARGNRPARPVLADFRGAFPGSPLAPWPAAEPGLPFIAPTGRGVPRLIRDARTGRCAHCSRAVPRRLGGTLISHKAAGERCPGSGQPPGEDLTIASWLPVLLALTPHGYRHGLQTWMDEDGIPEVLKTERLGHELAGMHGVYGHISAAMRSELRAALEDRWEDSLRDRVKISPRSAVPWLDGLLAAQRAKPTKIGSQLVPRIGRRRRPR